MNLSNQAFYQLHSNDCSLVIDCAGSAPRILYWGSKLSHSDVDMLVLLSTRQEAQAGVEFEAPMSLTPEFGRGFIGDAGIQIHRDGRDWGTGLEIVNSVQADNSLSIVSHCAATQINVEHRLSLDIESNVLKATTTLENTADAVLTVNKCNAPCFPVPQHIDQIMGFEGNWAQEFQTQHVERFSGSYVRENRSGRTSHHSFPGVVLHAAQAHHSGGEAYGFHLGWSGNHQLRVEQCHEARAFLQMGELLYPGELQLAAGEKYTSPTLFASYSDQGLSPLSNNFHRFVRTNLTDKRMEGKAKPIHFNTWEAMYFDMTVEKLCVLADEAADVGVERFVLDDGWFMHRRGDNAGLGDWYVEPKIFPDGLTPVVEHVNKLGMEFGLWVEPEMVNPDSDLYRAHPDWVLRTPDVKLHMGRNQLVLDLTRTEVQDYLFERLDSLLSEYNISYIKWDMNRDLSQPGGHDGRVAVHKQTLALYTLLDKLRQAHPTVEIESCASGGGRADYGILQYTDRVWTSDSNDAMDRLRIQQGFGYFFPPEFMGAHVGPRDCHITGRVISMATRCGVALFGDMGIEANILEMDEAEKDELKAAVALHKEKRGLLHSGDLYRLNSNPNTLQFGVVSPCKSEAMFLHAQTQSYNTVTGSMFRFEGLAADTNYRLSLLWPHAPRRYSEGVLEAVEGKTFSGEALMKLGVQLPIMFPDTLLVFELTKV